MVLLLEYVFSVLFPPLIPLQFIVMVPQQTFYLLYYNYNLTVYYCSNES